MAGGPVKHGLGKRGGRERGRLERRRCSRGGSRRRGSERGGGFASQGALQMGTVGGAVLVGLVVGVRHADPPARRRARHRRARRGEPCHAGLGPRGRRARRGRGVVAVLRALPAGRARAHRLPRGSARRRRARCRAPCAGCSTPRVAPPPRAAMAFVVALALCALAGTPARFPALARRPMAWRLPVRVQASFISLVGDPATWVSAAGRGSVRRLRCLRCAQAAEKGAAIWAYSPIPAFCSRFRLSSRVWKMAGYGPRRHRRRSLASSPLLYL